MKPKQSNDAAWKIIALSRPNQGRLTARQGHLRHSIVTRAEQERARIAQWPNQSIVPRKGRKRMWRTVWSEVVEVFWLASTVAGLSLFSIAIAAAAVAFAA
jgi:hypothetical protein